MEISEIALQDVETALADQSASEHRWLIDPRTGNVTTWTPEIDLDELDLLTIDPLPSRVWYRDMVDFAQQVGDETVAARLGRALGGKGAFGRFRAQLQREAPELVPAWMAFRAARARRRAVEWLLEAELIDDREAHRLLERGGAGQTLR